MSEETEKGNHNPFLYLIIISVLVVIFVSSYSFYLKKDYNFIVETSCDNTTEACRYRDCSIKDECPPNNFSYYNIYTIKASDFNFCKNEDCTLVCKEGTISCTKEECTEEDFSSGMCMIADPIELIPVAPDPEVKLKK